MVGPQLHGTYNKTVLMPDVFMKRKYCTKALQLAGFGTNQRLAHGLRNKAFAICTAEAGMILLTESNEVKQVSGSSTWQKSEGSGQRWIDKPTFG